ncbi:hypothetical protein ABDK56_04230 [Sphingomonas sp. ASV193]|uniref:hypothetical protein n=1 Tax=Sphingomonas sp. ASV193 TaxID=3144405 RepID=UPI0032E8FE24
MNRSFTKAVSVATLAAVTATSFAGVADARKRHRYYGSSRYHYKYCRHSPATTGAVAGGVGGAVVGSQVLGHGLLGIGAGAVAGVVAGKAIDRTLTARQRCYYR